MLVLSRREQESIRIGEDIIVTIVRIRGNQVQVGVQAASEVKVLRQEVFELIQASKERFQETETP